MDTRHIPGIHAGSFLIPAGNGLPDLEVLTSDPAGWVSMQIAARQKPVEATPVEASTTSDGASDLLGKITGITSLKDTLQGLVIASGMVLLAVLLVILGAYYLIKD